MSELKVVTRECLAQDHRHCPGNIFPPDPRIPADQANLPCECFHHSAPVKKAFGQR